MAYAHGLGPCLARDGGSTPLRPTQTELRLETGNLKNKLSILNFQLSIKYMISAIQKQPNRTISLTITIPSAAVQTASKEVLEEMGKNITLPGFRKGNAPSKLVEEKIDKEMLKEEILKKLLPVYYTNAIKDHNLRPIINPKIHIEKLEESKDWQFVALTCEAPVIELNNYKDSVKKITAASKIIIPGKEQVAPKFEDIVKALLDNVTVTIPELIVETEVERLLSQTLDEIKRLGLTLDQYLSSTGRKPEDLKTEYRKRAENDLKLEFILQKVAEAEKITVEEKEIDEAVQKAKSDDERKNLETNRHLLANILRQQKTLDFIKNL